MPEYFIVDASIDEIIAVHFWKSMPKSAKCFLHWFFKNILEDYYIQVIECHTMLEFGLPVEANNF